MICTGHWNVLYALELRLSIFCYGYLYHRIYHEILTGLEERIVNKGTHIYYS